MDLRSHGLPVDIKAAGGLIVAPPSVRPDTGGQYVIDRGSWDDLERLPVIRPAALTMLCGATLQVRRGERNDELFRELLRQARHCDALADLEDVALTRAADWLHDPEDP